MGVIFFSFYEYIKMSVVADYMVNFCGYTMCLEEMIIRYKF